MKFFYFIALLALAVGILRAQTNASNTNAVADILALVTTNAPASPPKTNAPTLIDSDSADFDLNGRKAVYYGNVRVKSPQMNLICAQLTVDLPPEGGRISHIVAETNVVIDATDEKGAAYHITSDKAVYDYNLQGTVTNETITFTGHPYMENSQYTNTADLIVWDRANGHIHETNPQMGPAQNPNGTNTNFAPTPKLF